MKKSQDRKDRSIAKHLGLAFHDRKQRAYKQASFSILLKEHEALILIEALTHYETECQNDYNKNLARKLITWIHQPSCNY
ncbi:hypothetical protein [Bizionia myxarmorum]|uniref:Uncharacterized protein n=1 Tax=Bizionia myxarmorum TaxID=291186 RepID=A0A5D0R9J7_9FLAO|nr:hypothetical protein [Bizionia myxarmorum]TYB78320.1 hypothetical protein ES674_00640 [Bizionia myxarmorum]